jgi:hypothetical protein
LRRVIHNEKTPDPAQRSRLFNQGKNKISQTAGRGSDSDKKVWVVDCVKLAVARALWKCRRLRATGTGGRAEFRWQRRTIDVPLECGSRERFLFIVVFEVLCEVRNGSMQERCLSKFGLFGRGKSGNRASSESQQGTQRSFHCE